MINFSILLISLYVFLETLGYGIYEFKNQNKLGGSIVCVLFLLTFVHLDLNRIVFDFLKQKNKYK